MDNCLMQNQSVKIYHRISGNIAQYIQNQDIYRISGNWKYL